MHGTNNINELVLILSYFLTYTVEILRIMYFYYRHIFNNYFNWNILKDDCGGAGVGTGDLRSHNLATPQDSISVGAVFFESIAISVGPIY